MIVTRHSVLHESQYALTTTLLYSHGSRSLHEIVGSTGISRYKGVCACVCVAYACARAHALNYADCGNDTVCVHYYKRSSISAYVHF